MDPTAFFCPPTYFAFLLVVTVLHELAHALTKHFFPNTTTPPTIKSSRRSKLEGGEARWYLEDRLFKGFMIARWTEGQAFRMDALRALEYETADNKGTYTLDGTHFHLQYGIVTYIV